MPFKLTRTEKQAVALVLLLCALALLGYLVF